jgi:hypothetical protein
VRLDVDKAGTDNVPTAIDHLARVRRIDPPARSNGGNSTIRYRDIAVEPRIPAAIDHFAARYQEIVVRHSVYPFPIETRRKHRTPVLISKPRPSTPPEPRLQWLRI